MDPSPRAHRDDQCQGGNGALTTRQLLQALVPGLSISGEAERHPIVDSGPCCCYGEILQGHTISRQISRFVGTGLPYG